MQQQYTPLPPIGRPNSTTAIISLIAGITGWTILPFLGAVVAVITGHMAKSEIKRSAGTIGGNGMATAGLILGYLSLALGICALCVLVLLPIMGITLFSIPGITNSAY